MRLRCAFELIIGLSLVLGVGLGVAGELADFNGAVEAAASHHRAVLGYLRTGNTDLAVAELERMDKEWQALVARFADRRPDAFDGNELYAQTLTGVASKLATAHVLIDSGRAETARDALQTIRGELAALRRASGIVVLADCVLDANNAMDALFVYKDAPPDWPRPQVRSDVSGKAAILGHELRRCDAIAPASVRNNARRGGS